MAVSPAGLTMRSSKSGAGLPTSGGAYCDQHGRPRIYGLPPRQQEQELCLLAPAARGCARPFAARSRSRKDPGQRERARTARQAAACQRRVRPSCRRPRAGAAGALGRWRRAWLQGRGRALQPPLCAPPSLQAVLPRTGRPAAVPASPSRLPGPRRPSPLFSHFLPGFDGRTPRTCAMAASKARLGLALAALVGAAGEWRVERGGRTSALPHR